MACPYCLSDHAGDCPRDPNLAARQAREASRQADAHALRAIGAAQAAQELAAVAVRAAETAERSIKQATAIVTAHAVDYERTHPGGMNRRRGLVDRRVGLRDDWIRWKNPERRIGLPNRRHYA